MATAQSKKCKELPSGRSGAAVVTGTSNGLGVASGTLGGSSSGALAGLPELLA